MPTVGFEINGTDQTHPRLNRYALIYPWIWDLRSGFDGGKFQSQPLVQIVWCRFADPKRFLLLI